MLPARVSEHIATVCARVEKAARGETLAGPVKLTALVHEEPPDRIPDVLMAAGLEDQAPLVTAIVRGFGEVWRLDERDSLTRFVAAHRGHLPSLLLFELAHEGAATEPMRAAANAGGCADDFARWASRLER